MQFAFEEVGMEGEKLKEYQRFDAVADEAYDRQDDAEALAAQRRLSGI